MDLRVLLDERKILSLLLGKLEFLFSSAVIWAKDIHHFSALKDNDVLLGSVIARFDQPLPLLQALLLEFLNRVFREVHLTAAVAEVG